MSKTHAVGANGVVFVRSNGDVLLQVRDGAPDGRVDGSGTAQVGYAEGCMYIRTDATGTDDALYINNEPVTGSDFISVELT